MKNVAILLCVILAGMWGNSGVAAESTVSTEPVPTPNKFGVTGLYTLLGNDTPAKNTLSIGFISDFSSFNLPEDPRTPSLGELGLHVGLSLGQRIEIAGLFPYRMLNVSEEENLEEFDETGMGDILITAKVRMLDEWEVLPAIGMYSMLSFPTGDEKKGLGSGTVDVTFGGIVTKDFEWTTLYGNIGYLLSGWDEGDPNPLFDNYQNSLLYGAGVEFPLISERIRMFSELTFVHEFEEDKDNEIMTFRGMDAAEAADDEDTDGGAPTEEDAIPYPNVYTLEDLVDDAGQMSVGMNVQVSKSLVLNGGAAFQILGDDPVPDGPKWRAFVNLSYLLGLRTVAKSVGIQPFPGAEAQPVPVAEGKPAPAIEVRPVPADATMQPLATQSTIQPSTASGDQLQNQCPEISNIILSDSLVNGGGQVRMSVTASDPDHDRLSYLWIVPRGQITGKGSAVVWTAPQCNEIDNTSGVYTVSIAVSDGICSREEYVKLSVLCDGGIGRVPESTIRFLSGSTKVDNIAKAQLDKLALLLKQFPNETIILEGHADNTGKEQQNIQIGLTRAENVKRYLTSRHGIDPNRMTVLSHGSTQPAASNATAAGRAQNRRVEIFRRF